MRKLVGILLGLYIATHLAACTSKESREDESAPQVEESAAADGELETADSSGTTTADETKAGFVDDQLPDQAMGDQSATELETAPATTDDSLAATPPVETPLTDSTATADMTSTDSALTAPPAEEVPAVAADTSTSGVDLGTPVTSTEENLEKKSETFVDQPKKPMASLKKVDDSPRMHKGVPLNAVYLARPGDTYKSIAKMIYQDAGKQSDLKKYNPSISKPNPGDKIYYNSPTRSGDTSVVKNYYEEMGYQPEVYIAKEGDHLPKVAKKLLGYDKAWKEIWVTNSAVDSKDSLMAGTELKYWKKPAVLDQPTNVATNTEMAAPVAPPVPEQQPSAAMNDMAAALPPPPPVDELPPPPADMGSAATGTTAANELPPPPPPADLPPPPPPAEMAPPPPPPVAAKPPKNEVVADETIGGMSNDDMMMGLAGVGIIAAGVAAMMVIRKRRQQKEMQAAFGDTQIGAS